MLRHHRPSSSDPIHGSRKLRAGFATHSGGLVYHLRALRHRSLWRPFAGTVAGWLSEWRPPCPQLVIVGPSAGYSLPVDFLARFDEIVALEPDPLARWLLPRRLAGIRFTFDDVDCLSDPAGLSVLDARFPDAAFLFSNVLGQIPAAAGGSWSARLAAHLAHRHWASWHDAISTEKPPRAMESCRVEQPAPLETVLARFWSGGELPLTDHETFGLGGQGPHGYAIWQLRPAGYHLVEWYSHHPAAHGAPTTTPQ